MVRGFRDYLHTQGFTEIHTPKIVAASAEGGANVFRMDYFGKKAYLAQSPQFYKQTLVAVYERVFEVGPVFRAEKHNTTRHLNEYTGLDFEMGYIHSFTEIMDMEAGMLQYVFNLLQKDYANELRALQIELPSAEKIPTVRFREAKEAIAEAYNRQNQRIPLTWSRRKNSSSASTIKKNAAAILFLLPIIRRRSALSTPWMIRRIPLYPELRPAVPRDGNHHRAASASTITTSRWKR